MKRLIQSKIPTAQWTPSSHLPSFDASYRQGDPGSTRFFLSLEDNMLRIFGGDRIGRMMDMFQIDVNVPIESGMLVYFKNLIYLQTI